MIYAEDKEIPLVIENELIAWLILVIDIAGPFTEKLKYINILSTYKMTALQKICDHFPTLFRSGLCPSHLVEILCSIPKDNFALLSSQVFQSGFIGFARDNSCK